MSASAVAAFVLCAFIAGRADAETKIAVGIVSHGTSQWPQYIAEEFGWFKNAGLSLDMVSVGNGTAQQLAAGAIDVAHSGFPEFIRATNQGAHVKIVINDIGVPPYTVYAKPAIKTIAALRGKTISIGGIKDVTLIYMKPLLASAGLTARDVDFVFAKASGDRFSALAGGAVGEYFGGIVGAAVGCLAGTLVGSTAAMTFVVARLGLRLPLAALAGVLAAAAIMGAGLRLVPAPIGALGLAAQIVAGALVYAATIFVLFPQARRVARAPFAFVAERRGSDP